MSEFKKAVAALEPLEAELAAIQLGTSDPVSHLQRVEGLSIASEEQALLWNKFHKRAIETDEDKQVYGEKMVARVLEGWNRYQLAQSTTTELLEAAQEAAAPEIARIEQQQQFEAAATVQRQAEREACELEEETRAKEATAAAAAALERQQAEDLQTLLRREEEQREHVCGGVGGELVGVGDGRFVLEVAGVWSGRARWVPVGHAGFGYDQVGAGHRIGAVRWLSAVGKLQRSGPGGAGAVSAVDGVDQFWPVGAPMEVGGENRERQEPHGSQPW